MTREELYCQSLSDLNRAVIILAEILETKKLSREEEQRIAYGTKLLKDAKSRQIKLTKNR